MDERLVLCGGLPPRKRGLSDFLALDKSPNAPAVRRVEVKLDTLSAQLVDNLDPVLRDAVEVAAYVLMADRLIKRGTDRMERMGAQWRRRLIFKIPVRQRHVWTSSEVLTCLIQTLTFLSEDEFVFDFEQGDPDAILDPYLGFADAAAQRIRPDDIILFSGGLDSLAGAVEQLIGHGRTVALVTHKSSTNIAARQDSLARTLEQRAQHRLFYAPVWVRKGHYEPVEHTQRTRSFLFAALGIAVARMFDRDTVQFFENGITSFNLPIAEHVIGTRASRTTHPRVLESFSHLFSLLTQRKIAIENKYLWHTKRDVAQVVQKHGCADMVRSSISCAQVRNLAMTDKQCGVCSQCIERRYAILGAGMQEHDDATGYAIDLFTGAHSKPLDITMSEEHLLRAHRLSSMSEHSFLASYGQIFRALPFLPGGTSDSASQIFQLHQRYGTEVLEVASAQMQKHAGLQRALELSSTSLLAMSASPVGIEVTELDATETEPAASVQAASNPGPVRDRRIIFAVDEATQAIIFADGPCLTGAGYKFIKRLAQQFRADWEGEAERCDYKYVPTNDLMRDLKITEHSVGQRAARVRKDLRERFLTETGYLIDDEDVIQSESWRGYRLNPYLVMVPPTQVSNRNVKTPSASVMTRAAGH
jgi:hypothetical protein